MLMLHPQWLQVSFLVLVPPYNVLIDSGATHSFVDSRVIDNLCRPCDYYTVGFGVIFPTGEMMVSKRRVRSLPFDV